MVAETLRRTPLYDEHVALNARIVPFAGYELPVQYASVIAEVKAVRDGAGMFDVSHMARLKFTGERVLEFLEWITTNDVAKLEDGRGHYSMLPNPTGGVVDDIILYRISATEFRMVVNGANHEKDVAWMKSQNSFGVQIEDSTFDTAMIAVQGPRAREIVANLSDNPEAIKAAPLFGVNDSQIAGIRCFAPCSGYTGEDGFELICAKQEAGALWKALLAAGVAPCGLASRDALRVEAGLPLYGHELADDINPISAGLGWVIGKTKAFIGSEPIQAARAGGTPKKLQGVRLGSKRLTAPGMEVFVGDRKVGEITSGVFSPTLDCGIAFAFIDSNVPLQTPCEVEIRGKREPATIVGKRFLKGT